MNEYEFMKLINKTFNDIEDYHIVYALKEYKVKFIKSTQINVLKYCIILDYLSMNITSRLIGICLNRNSVDVNGAMAKLGDKRVLDLKGYAGNILVYGLHEDFKIVLRYDLIEPILKKNLGVLNE